MDRRKIIRELIQTKPFVSLSELEKIFPDVSSMTLRRDINYFDEQGEVIKVRGGAKSMKFIKTSMEDSYESRAGESIDVKRKICVAAACHMEIGRSLFLDSGTTIMQLTEHIGDERYTITTSAPNVAIKLLRNYNIIVNLVGGMVNRDNISVSGSQAMDFLNSVNIDVAFIVPSGVSLDNGFTSGNYNECELKKFIVSKAKRKIFMFDDKKLEKALPYTFAKLSDADCIITNAQFDTETVNNLTKTEIIKIT